MGIGQGDVGKLLKMKENDPVTSRLPYLLVLRTEVAWVQSLSDYPEHESQSMRRANDFSYGKVE